LRRSAIRSSSQTGDKKAAIHLASLIISRDSNVIKFFDYLPKPTPEFLNAMTQSPLLIRLIVETDRLNTNSVYDRFSFDSRTHSSDPRNYYFWSSALVAQEMEEKGFSKAEILELNLQFPRFYKILRYYENLASNLQKFLSGKGWQSKRESFFSESVVVMKNAGDGVQLALAPPPSKGASVVCRALFKW
jgi:hypothetical protein